MSGHAARIARRIDQVLESGQTGQSTAPRVEKNWTESNKPVIGMQITNLSEATVSSGSERILCFVWTGALGLPGSFLFESAAPSFLRLI